MFSFLKISKEKTILVVLSTIICSFLSQSCSQFQRKTEQYISDNIKEEIINTSICEDGSETINIIDIKFDNNPEDNSGTKFKINGVATIANDVEREVTIDVDIASNRNMKFTFGDETQSSMKNRLLKLLTSSRYSSIEVLYGEERAPELISFEVDNTGYYEARDGDRYSFDFSIDNVVHVNDFPITSDCRN
jgi:hypothetical protein